MSRRWRNQQPLTGFVLHGPPLSFSWDPSQRLPSLFPLTFGKVCILSSPPEWTGQKKLSKLPTQMVFPKSLFKVHELRAFPHVHDSSPEHDPFFSMSAEEPKPSEACPRSLGSSPLVNIRVRGCSWEFLWPEVLRVLESRCGRLAALGSPAKVRRAKKTTGQIMETTSKCVQTRARCN